MSRQLWETKFHCFQITQFLVFYCSWPFDWILKFSSLLGPDWGPLLDLTNLSLCHPTLSQHLRCCCSGLASVARGFVPLLIHPVKWQDPLFEGEKKFPLIAGSNLSWDIHITPATFLYSVVWAPLRGEAIILHRKALPYSSWGGYFLLAVFLEASQWEHSSFTPHCQHSKSDFSSLLPKAFCKIPRAPSECSSLGA